MCAGTDDSGFTYVGKLPWMTHDATAASVCIPRVAALQRQCELSRGELEYRWLHEVPALLAGTELRARRLQEAAQALMQPRSAAGGPQADADELHGRAVMLKREAAQLRDRLKDDQAQLDGLRTLVERTLEVGAAAASGASDEASGQCSDVGSVMWDAGAADDASDCSSVARLRQEELHDEQAMHEVLPELAMAVGHSAPPHVPAQREPTNQPLGRSVTRAAVAAAATEAQAAADTAQAAEGTAQAAEGTAQAGEGSSDCVMPQPAALGALVMYDMQDLRRMQSHSIAGSLELANGERRVLKVGALRPLLDKSLRLTAWVSHDVLNFYSLLLQVRCVAEALIAASIHLCSHKLYMLPVGLLSGARVPALTAGLDAAELVHNVWSPCNPRSRRHIVLCPDFPASPPLRGRRASHRCAAESPSQPSGRASAWCKCGRGHAPADSCACA